MSVEERLRHAYRDDDTTRMPLVSSYDAVVAGSRRRRRQRIVARGLVTAVAGLAIVVAVLSAIRPSDSIEPAPPSRTITGSTGEVLAGGVTGTWRSQQMTRATVVQGLRDAGFATHAADYARTRLPHGQFRVHLLVDENEISVRVGNREASTSAIVGLHANRIELHPDGAGAGTTTLLWRLDGGALFLLFDSTTALPPDGAFPAGMDEVATYNLAAFSRVG
jgi:hypothetical protein